MWGAVGSKRRQTKELEPSYEEGSGTVGSEDLGDLNVKFCLIFIIFSSFLFSYDSLISMPISPKCHKKYQYDTKLVSL